MERLCEQCGKPSRTRFCGESCRYRADLEENRRKARERYWRNHERYSAAARERARERRRRDPEGERARERAYWARNHEKKLAKDRRAQLKRDPEDNRERYRRWVERHPEEARHQGRIRQATRLARKLGAFVEHIDPLVVLERDDGVCGICGQDVDPQRFDVDHVVPLARGGEHSYANVQVAHPRCNQRKFTHLPEEMAA